jgi:predicted RNA-binding Zn-ribbon protein involved in translation (DUF1610 family)
MTAEKLPDCEKLTLFCVCSNCGFSVFEMIVLEKDGTVSFASKKASRQLCLWRYRPVSVPIEGAKVSISCGSCGQEVEECHLSKRGDGISFTLGSLIEVTKGIAP